MSAGVGSAVASADSDIVSERDMTADPRTSVISISPIGRPSSSTTGSSLRCCSARSRTASPSRVPAAMRKGDRVMTSAIGRSSQAWRSCSSNRARSLSVKMPETRTTALDHDAPHRSPVGCHATLIEGPHLFLDPCQLSPQLTAGMKTREVFHAEPAKPAGHQGQRIAERQHRCRACRRRKPQRTGFLEPAQLKHDLSRAAKRTVGMAGDGNQRIAHLAERSEQADDLLSVPAEGKDKKHIVPVEGAQVPVKGLRRMQEVAGRSRRSQRGGDLAANQTGLADAGDHHMTPALGTKTHRLEKSVVELPSQIGQGSAFRLEHIAAPRKLRLAAGPR